MDDLLDLMFLEGVSIKENAVEHFFKVTQTLTSSPTLGPKFMECKQTPQGAHDLSMHAF